MLPETARRKVQETEQRLGHWDTYVRSIYITILVIMAYLLGYEFDLMAPLHGGAAVVLVYLVWVPPHMWDLALIIVLAMLMSQALGFAENNNGESDRSR